MCVYQMPQTAWSHQFFLIWGTLKHNFKNAFKHYAAFQDKERHRLSFTGTSWWCLLLIMLNWGQNVNNSSTQAVPTKPKTSLKSTGGSKGRWFPLEKEKYDRADCKTGNCNSWVLCKLAPQLSRGEKRYILHRRHRVSVLHSHNKSGYWTERKEPYSSPWTLPLWGFIC